MAPYGRIPVFTAPSSARAGGDVLVSASVKNAGNVGGYFWLKYYNDDTGLVVGSYPQQWILNGVTTNFPEKTLTMPDSDFKISAKVFCENDTLLQDTRTQVVSLVTGSGGDGVCKGDTHWRPVGYAWAHCMGGEEECVSVEFVQSSLSGDKAVLMVNRSWEYLDVSEILRSGESQTYEGKKAKWTVKVNGVAGSGAAGSAIVDICYELPIDCPPPTVSIPTVSNYNPASGDPVDFTSYASGGVGHTIVSRHWDFGDGTSSTEENPSKTWTNTTGADVEYTVTFTATNECGTSNSTTTVITVSSAPAKHGIEIQFPPSMDGKDLIAHGAISTILGLWWTGPHVVDGVIWNKGRCTWENIDSSKKYNILVGDACQEREAIDGVVPEHPTECAGTFSNNDSVIILIRNPGFDFRVYNADDIFTLTDSSFSVLYLDETSGDIVDKTFAEWICGLIGLESGYECDMFWAEFYDPIFVANYMSIQKTGKDIMGTPRELGWLDHVAFVASLVGSLPAFNLFPFAGITKNLGNGIIVIARKVKDLAGDELAKAGGAMADICVNAPKVISDLIQSELDEVRAALVKVYGDVQGNKYVDDALAAGRSVFDTAYDLIKNADISGDDLIEFTKLLDENPGLSGELADVHKAAMLRGPTRPERAAVCNHARSNYTTDIVEIFKTATDAENATLAKNDHLFSKIVKDYNTIESASDAVTTKRWVKSWAENEIKVLKGADAAAMDIPDALDDYVHSGTVLSDLPADIRKVPDTFADTEIDKWEAEAKASAQSFGQKCWETWNALSEVGKLSSVEKMMVLSLAFVTTVLYGIYRYAAGSSDEPTVYAITHAQFTHNMEQFYWKCRDAQKIENWETLADAIVEYERCVNEAEEDLEYRAEVLKRGGTYDDFYNSLKQHQFSLANFIKVLNDATNSGTVVVESNVKGFYAQLDEAGDLVTDYQSGQVVFHGVPAGDHHAYIQKGGYTSCTTPSKAVTPGDITTVSCDLVEIGCVKPVPTITGPAAGIVKQAVQFTGAATTESEITWWSWDFGDGDDSHDQSPSHMYWNAGTYAVKLTVTDDCGTATAEHEIIITAESGIPDPTPTEEAGTLLIKKPVNAQNNIECNRAWEAEIFVDNVKMSDGPQLTIQFGTNKYVGSYGGACGVPHTIKVRLDGYQDVEQSWTINDGDDKTWIPKMYLEGYTPPPLPAGTHKIDFYIPEGATLGTPAKITLLKKLTTRMRRIRDNE